MPSPRHSSTRLQLAALLALSLFLAACATPPPAPVIPPAARLALDEARRNFTFAGQPIHPAVVHLFDTDISGDNPDIIAIDVREAQESNLAASPVTILNGAVAATSPDPDVPLRCEYERLGVLADGTQVVKTEWNGGGSGVFEHLLLLRFEIDGWHHYDGTLDWRLVLRVVTFLPLGDHDEGVITVEPNRVIVGPTPPPPKTTHSVRLKFNPPNADYTLPSDTPTS
jgi:hypothetical protein